MRKAKDRRTALGQGAQQRHEKRVGTIRQRGATASAATVGADGMSLSYPPNREAPRPRRRTAAADAAVLSGREWLEQNIYCTLHPALVALDRCRPHDDHELELLRMPPAKFLGRCLVDRGFLDEVSRQEIEMDAKHSLLTFMEGNYPQQQQQQQQGGGALLPDASYRVDEILRKAVHSLSKSRPDDPLREMAEQLFSHCS